MTITLYNGVQFKVEIGFGMTTTGGNAVPYGGLASNIAWTDVSSSVKSASIQRGRSNELDSFSAGSASVVLDNRDRRFDPDFGPAWLLLPGTTGNYVSTPDAAKWDITDDFDIRARVAPTLWSGTATGQVIVAKSSSLSTISYRFAITAAGLLTLLYSTDGTTTVNVNSTVATGFTNGTSNWLRVTRKRSTGVVTFFTAPDSPIEPTSWTQLGSTVASVTTAYFASSSPVEIGTISSGTANFFAGYIRRVLVSSTIGGAAIGDFDPTSITSVAATTVTSTTGEVWTKNTSGSPSASWTVGGPYFGALNPMRPIRISAVAPGRSMESMFVGFVDGWPQSYDPPNNSTVQLNCSDAFKVLSLIPLDSSWVDTVVADSPRAWLRMNEPSQSATINDTASNYTAVDAMTGATGWPFDRNPGYYITAGIVASSGTQGPSLVLSDTTDFSQEFDGTRWAESGQDGLWATPVNYRAQYYAYPMYGCEVAFALDFFTPWPGSYGICAFGGPTGYLQLGAFVSVSGAGTATLYVLTRNFGFGAVQVWTATIGSLAPWVWTALGPKHIMFGLNSANATVAYFNGVAMTPLTTFAGVGWNRWTVGHCYNTGSATYTAGSPFKGQIDEVVLYDRVPSPARVAAHYDAFESGAGETTGSRVTRVLNRVGWPTDAVDIDAGDSTLQKYIPSGSALSYLQQVEQAEQGKMFIDRYGRLSFQSRSDLNLNATYGTTQLSLTDSEYVEFQPNYTDQLIKNEISITREGSLPQVRYDPVSQGQYFLRPEVTTGLLNDEDETISYMVEARLSAYAYPRPRVDSVTVMPRGSGLWEEAIEFDLGTRISTTRDPQGISPVITRAAIIEGIQHDISLTNWTTTWLLSPAEVTDFLVLDNTELDKVGWASSRLGY